MLIACFYKYYEKQQKIKQPITATTTKITTKRKKHAGTKNTFTST